MQLGMALFTKIGTTLAASVGLEVAGTAAASTGASVVSTAVSTAGTVAAMNMQASALEEAAKFEEQQAKRVVAAGFAEAKDADFEIALAMSQEQASQGASGLAINSGSFVRRRERQAVIGRANRHRIVQDAVLQGRGAQNRASVNRTEARLRGFESAYTIAAGGLQLGADLIEGAALYREGETARTQQRRIRI